MLHKFSRSVPSQSTTESISNDVTRK